MKIEREIVLSADFMPVLTSYFRMPEINMSGKEHSNLDFNSIRKKIGPDLNLNLIETGESSGSCSLRDNKSFVRGHKL